MTVLVESECSISIPGVKRKEKLNGEKEVMRQPNSNLHTLTDKERQRSISASCNPATDATQRLQKQLSNLCLQSGRRPLTRKASRMETFGTKKESRFPKKAGEFVVPTTYLSESFFINPTSSVSLKDGTKSRNYQTIQL